MRIKMRYIFLIAILIVGIGVVRNITRTPYTYNDPNIPIQSLGYRASTPLTVIKSVTELRQGETGFIKLQGQPGERYTIKSSYVRGDRIFNVIQQQKADGNGQVTFTWVVGRDTVPGVYPIMITGEGKTLNLYHTVLK